MFTTLAVVNYFSTKLGDAVLFSRALVGDMNRLSCEPQEFPKKALDRMRTSDLL